VLRHFSSAEVDLQRDRRFLASSFATASASFTMYRHPPCSTLFPYSTLFRSDFDDGTTDTVSNPTHTFTTAGIYNVMFVAANPTTDRKSTRLNSSHVKISYAVFCLKKKKPRHKPHTKPPLQDTQSHEQDKDIE